jgi:putative transcriptional regulator
MKIQKTKYQLEVVNRVRSLRTERNISQIKIASILDVSSGYIGNVESPKFQHKYTLKQLLALSSFFNVSLDYLLTGEFETLATDEIINLLVTYDG